MIYSYLLWLTLKRLNFFLNVRPGWRDLPRSLIKLNFLEIILGGTQWKYELLERKSSLVFGFKKMDWSKMSSMHVGVEDLLLVKCSQELIKWLNKKLFYFCEFLVDLRILFCLNRAKFWLKLSIKFNKYSMRSFQKAMVGFNNLWIHLIFKDYCWVLRRLGSRLFSFSRFWWFTSCSLF